VVKGVELDFLTFLRDYLISNPAALAEYNRLKVQHAAEGKENYWQAKTTFFAKILTAHNQ
ncbi:MAG: GrpB family protein, partial [Opitutaceae bacterium]